MGARRAKRAVRGFTVVELMIVVLILGILAALAAPNLGKMVRSQRIKTAAFDMYSSLTFARSEAIKRNVAVTITPANAGNWAEGWTIRDANNNLLRDQSGWVNAGETPVMLSITGPAAVSFASTGRLAAAVAPISLTSPYVENDAQRCVTLDLSGRATTKGASCAAPPPPAP